MKKVDYIGAFVIIAHCVGQLEDFEWPYPVHIGSQIVSSYLLAGREMQK